jgi:transcriptional regulator with XRE-family HTH domain
MISGLDRRQTAAMAIRDFRRCQNLTQAGLAGLLGVTDRYVRCLERHPDRLSSRILARLARLMRDHGEFGLATLVSAARRPEEDFMKTLLDDVAGLKKRVANLEDERAHRRSA